MTRIVTRSVTRSVLPLTLLTATFALVLPAQATLTRTFVSAAGSDANPCTITQPCATFAHAYSLTAASGIIAALDPGKYGPLTITGAITINGYGWAAITAPAAGNGITINAGTTDNVALIGLEIDGAGAGYDGIVLNSAGSLTVTNCTVQNFVYSGSGDNTGSGLFIQPASGSISFTITDTTVSNNGLVGILYQPTGSAGATGVIDSVTMTSNPYGIDLYTARSTGSAVVTLSNSVASNNSTDGIFANNGFGASLKFSIDNVTASGNATDGIAAFGSAQVLLGRSVITGNGANGINNSTSPNTFYTYKDNRINDNGTDISGALNTTFPVQ
jgi:hypothetical protein